MLFVWAQSIGSEPGQALGRLAHRFLVLVWFAIFTGYNHRRLIGTCLKTIPQRWLWPLYDHGRLVSADARVCDSLVKQATFYFWFEGGDERG